MYNENLADNKTAMLTWWN